MSSIAQVAYPASEPVSANELKNYAKVFITSDDALVADQITAAREYIEDMTGLCLASRNFIQFEDGLPCIPFGFSAYSYSASQNALFGTGPFFPLPPMGWNPRVNPFEILILRNPVTNIDHLEYVDLNGINQSLLPYKDFDVDLVSIPARITPLPGRSWPQGMMGTNNVAIFLTAGFTSGSPSLDSGIETVSPSIAPSPPDQLGATFNMTIGVPRALKIATLQLAGHWYENRGPVSSGSVTNIPHSLDAIIKSYRVLSLQATTRY
jgi:hypothetical protein